LDIGQLGEPLVAPPWDDIAARTAVSARLTKMDLAFWFR
jgi:hypothetical protein